MTKGSFDPMNYGSVSFSKGGTPARPAPDASPEDILFAAPAGPAAAPAPAPADEGFRAPPEAESGGRPAAARGPQKPVAGPTDDELAEIAGHSPAAARPAPARPRPEPQPARSQPARSQPAARPAARPPAAPPAAVPPVPAARPVPAPVAAAPAPAIAPKPAEARRTSVSTLPKAPQQTWKEPRPTALLVTVGVVVGGAAAALAFWLLGFEWPLVAISGALGVLGGTFTWLLQRR
ncbi:MAG: hypothetical protein IT458_05795 [Planctomycetes bacterium]|nr:hypothetical protein [Planctomycetota bacterium]